MLNKRLSLEQAVGLIKDGDTILFGGWGASRKPLAIVRQIVRSELKDLTVVSMGCLDADLLIAAGKVRKVIYAYLGYQQVPGIPGNCRQARQNDRVEMKEISEGMFLLGLRAAAERVPFAPTRSGIGTDLLSLNGIKTISCPYTHETLVAMPAIRGDIAFLHVNLATLSGYGYIAADPWLDRIMARAASKTVLCTERVISQEELQKTSPKARLLLRVWINGVVEVPYGAHPTSCFPDYGIDKERLDEYTRASNAQDTTLAYLDKYIRSVRDHQEYINLMGGTERLSQIDYR